MNKVNVLGLVNSNLRNNRIEPSTRNVDPNRIVWPYLRSNELSNDTPYLMRIMPSDPLKNPHGVVRKAMYQIPMKLDMSGSNFPKHDSHYVMMPECLDMDAEDPIRDVVTKMLALMAGPSKYEYVYEKVKNKDGKVFNKLVEKVAKLDDEGNELEETPSDIFREELENNNELKLFFEVLTKPWTQFIMPVLICATCTATKNADGYTRYSNYTPDPTEENWIPRLFQVNDVKAFRDKVIPNLLPKTFDSPPKYRQWNDRYDGQNFTYCRDSGPPISYSFDKDSSGSLPGNYDALWEIGDNIPDLMQRELKSCAKDADQMLKMLRMSPYSHYLVKYGLLDAE